MERSKSDGRKWRILKTTGSLDRSQIKKQLEKGGARVSAEFGYAV
ncbi:hypothetical protein [Lentzea sp. NEAU-D7]|nr:hypothetical protein [Lentzea sp. NEAU-D7]